jgi:hypothetical protein
LALHHVPVHVEDTNAQQGMGWPLSVISIIPRQILFYLFICFLGDTRVWTKGLALTRKAHFSLEPLHQPCALVSSKKLEPFEKSLKSLSYC